MTADSLGDRMKTFENAFRHSLPIRMPIMARIDGKAFHSYTKGCERPFDTKLESVMNDTAKYLCENIQGAKLAYIQSDEISILINNYESLDSGQWFENNIQKMASVTAGMASGVFTSLSHHIFGATKLAVFDSRFWILPKEEVCNAFLWRQQDNTRNSVQMLARSLVSHKECTNKNNSQLQEMCFKKGSNWNDLPTARKRGRCIVKVSKEIDVVNRRTNLPEKAIRSNWEIDAEIPIFSQDRNYINRFVFTEINS